MVCVVPIQGFDELRIYKLWTFAATATLFQDIPYLHTRLPSARKQRAEELVLTFV